MRWLRMVQWLHSLQDTLHYGLYAIIAALVLEGTLFIIELILPREGAVPVAAVQQVVHHHHAHSIDATASYPSTTAVPARGSKPEAGAAAVSSSKFCPNCGVQAGAGHPFCSSCGSAL